jgi:hypothetical protein
MKTGYGIVYAIYYNNLPIYVGKTIRELKSRFADHKRYCFYQFKKNGEPFEEYNKELYKFIRSVTNENDFYNIIQIKEVKIVKIKEINYYEKKAIRYCVERGIKIYNVAHKKEMIK